jgi:hypothetical protein
MPSQQARPISKGFISVTKVLLLFAVAFAAEAQVTISGVTVDHLSHSTGLVHFTSSGTMGNYVDGNGNNNSVWWNYLKICWSTTPGTCAGGGGTILPTGYPNDQSIANRAAANFPAIVTGLPPASTVEVCPMVSQNRTTWAISCTTVTTAARPAAHPVAAELPRSVSIPTVPTDYTGFHSGKSTGQNTPGAITTCANLQNDMNNAQWDQGSYGTVITLAAGQGNKCKDRYYFGQNPPDVHAFGPPQVSTTNNTIDITGMGMGLTEGHGVQFAQNYSNLPGEFGTDPALGCNGIKPGQVYYAHFTNYAGDPNHMQLTCTAPYPTGPVMTLPDTGGGYSMYVAPYPRLRSQGGSLYPIVLRTATPDSQLPPPGTRMNPDFEPKLAVLEPDVRCPGTVCYYAPANGDRRAFALGFGDSFDDGDYKMTAGISVIGLEIQSIYITTSDDASYDPMPTWNLLSIKQGTSDNTIDRCYIHGQYPFPNRLAWGIGWEGHNNAIINSYFDRIVYPFHGPGQTDNFSCGAFCDSSYQTEGTQFIQAGTGPGPYIFYNNFLQTTGNGFHFNGAGDGGFTNTYVQDVLIQRNTFTQNPPGNPFGYCNGNPGADSWQYRNRQPLEFKGGWRAQMDGNIFEYDCHWLASAAVAVTSVTGGIFDMTFTNNTFRHVSAGSMGGSATQGGQVPLSPTSRYTYKNNLFWDVDGCKYIDHQSSAYGPNHGYCWNGYIVQTVQDGEDFTWDHNTVASTNGYVPDQFYLASGSLEGLKVSNSIIYAHSDAGTAGTGFGTRVDGGTNQDFAAGGACNGYNAEALLTCSWKYPSSQVSGNLITSDSLTAAQIATNWPSQKTTATPSNLSLVGWVNPSGDFRLRSSSAYISGGAQPAADKYDMGADIDALERAQGKVYFNSVLPTSTTAMVNFVAPDAQACPVDISSTDSTLVNSFTRTNDAGTAAGPRSVLLTGLTPRTNYYFRINCAVQQPVGSFHTN